MHSISSRKKRKSDLRLPNRADRAALDDSPGDFECLYNLILRAGGDRLFDEECNAGKAAQDLKLYIAARASGTTKHRRRANDYSARAIAGQHARDKVLEGLEDASVFIRGAHESLALLEEDNSRTLDVRVDKRDYLEAGAEFTVKETGMGGTKAM